MFLMTVGVLSAIVEGAMIVSGSLALATVLMLIPAAVSLGVRKTRHAGFAARAETIIDPAEHRRVLVLWAARSLHTAPPSAVRQVLRRLGFDYDAAVRRHLEDDPPPPIVALHPVLPESDLL